MDSKATYIKNILTPLGICGIGMVLGKTVFATLPLFEDSALLTALAFAGLPFGWRATRDIFDGIHGLGLITMLLYYVLRIGTSLMVGWAIMFYRLIKDTVQLIIVWRGEKISSQTDQKEAV